MTKDPLRYFRVEARELVDQLSQGVLELDAGPDRELVARLLRFAHTLKGAARVVRQRDIADESHAVEEILVPYRDGTEPVPAEGIAQLLALVDRMQERVAELSPRPAPAPAEAPNDEDGAGGGRRPAPAEVVHPVRSEMADVEELLEAVDEAHARFAPLRRQAATVERARRAAEALADRLRARRAHGGEHDRRADDQSGIMAGRLTAELTALGRQLTETVEQVERELDDVRGRAERLRLVPVATILTSLHRAVHDVASTQSKRVVFEGHGGDLRLDPHVLTQASSALLHVVRNAVAHGIEAETERQDAGKAPEGRVTVDVTRRGRYAAFCCRDDGRGFDLAAVRRAAEAQGLVAPGADADPRTLMKLLMQGGISTSATVTGVSGRGIGLDVVRDVAEQLGGEVTVNTQPGAGTTVELVVPLSLVSLSGLIVEAAGVLASVPLDAVRTCLRLSPSEVAGASSAAAVAHGGRVIPFLPLPRALSTQPWTAPANGAVAVVVSAGGGVAAVGVERLLGTSTLVVRPLPELAPASPVVSGLSLDGEGNPRVVLDPHGLVAAAGRVGATGPAPAAVVRPDEPVRHPVLVIDDSLTTRMLERSILESAGYRVDLAASGEEALERARHRQYALFLVDIDMPGIDGFTFVEQTRADPDLRGVPAILVSSRASAEDRRRGMEVGASAYVVKSEFNQEELLQHIRDLVGANG